MQNRPPEPPGGPSNGRSAPGGAGARPSAPQRRDPDIEFRELVKGRKSGEQYVRIHRTASGLRRRAPGQFEATLDVFRPRNPLGRLMASTRQILLGNRLATTQLAHERISKIKALAVFSSDALSSSAYATEEILLV